MREITLPPNQKVEIEQGLVIVGANGTGKTRLGAWIDNNSPEKNLVLRISAQKILSIPDDIRPMDLDKSLSDLLCGHQNATSEQFGDYKMGHKWGNKPAITLQNDYTKLLTYLFSEENEVSRKYREDSSKSESKIPITETKLDKVKKIWEEILPHRKLIFEGGTIKTRTDNMDAQSYHASEMSDGERVIFYLIGQCLSASTSGIVIVDEPELHLHKSIQYTLWNKIEKERRDCIFIYLTHDIEFAVSRNGFEKIWLKNFDGTNWDWSKLEEVADIPEELSIEVYGSRRKILLVEGENGKEDVQFYQNIFEDFLVKPCGSCKNVIEYTKSFRKNKDFHSLEVYGLIDRDRRTAEEIAALEASGIYTLKVAEVEHIFATPEILVIVSEQLVKDSSEQQKNIENYVFTELQSELQTQISDRENEEVKFLLSGIDLSNKTVPLAEFIGLQINENEIHTKIETEFKEILEKKDYIKLLEFYNRKTIASRIGDLFGLKKDELPNYVVRLSKDDKFLTKIKAAVLKYLPDELADIISPKKDEK
jgi:ABC-type dipeptide/oligopeptide/nickel transport system ATPase component